jgi:hypothetical protein
VCVGEYRVDPDGVLGVLAGLDDLANLETVPAAETPLAPQSFGYTIDGKRRFWDESE